MYNVNILSSIVLYYLAYPDKICLTHTHQIK